MARHTTRRKTVHKVARRARPKPRMGTLAKVGAALAAPFPDAELLVASMANPDSGIRFVLGIARRAGKRASEVQSVIFDKLKWTAAAAQGWLRDHGFTTPKVDEGATFWRFRQQDPKRFKEFRTVVPGTQRNPGGHVPGWERAIQVMTPKQAERALVRTEEYLSRPDLSPAQRTLQEENAAALRRRVYGEENPRGPLLSHQVLNEHIRMPGVPQLIVERGFAHHWWGGGRWTGPKHGIGSLDYAVYSAKAVSDPLTDLDTRNEMLATLGESLAAENPDYAGQWTNHEDAKPPFYVQVKDKGRWRAMYGGEGIYPSAREASRAMVAHANEYSGKFAWRALDGDGRIFDELKARPASNPTPGETISAYDEHLATTLDPAFQAATPDEQAAAMTVQDATENPMPLRSQLVHAVTEYDRKQEGKRGYNRYAIGHYLRAVDGVMEEVGKGYSVRSAISNNFTGRLADYLLRTVGEAPQTREEQMGPMVQEERNPDYSDAAPDVKAHIESHPGTWFSYLAYPGKTLHKGGYDTIYAAAKEAAVHDNRPIYFGTYHRGDEPARLTGHALAVWPDGHITWANEVPLNRANPDDYRRTRLEEGSLGERVLTGLDEVEAAGEMAGRNWRGPVTAAKLKHRAMQHITHVRGYQKNMRGMYQIAFERGFEKTYKGAKNPSDLGQAAFDAAKDFRLSGAYSDTGVANARVAGYGFSKWYNNLSPAESKGYRKATLKRNWMEGWAAGKRVEKKQARGNPESPAQALYEDFHGRPSAETLEIVTERHEHDWLTGLGQLVELKVATVTQLDATISFTKDKTAPELCSSEDGRQLYIEGGNQEIPLKSLKMDGPKFEKDSMVLGILTEVTYRTSKGFHKFRPTDYYHRLGEESGVQPTLLYDPRNKLLSISGGAYRVEDIGIVD